MDNFSLQKPLNMAPTGIATFAKTDLAPDIYNLNADIAILGAPFDLAIQGRTGCRLGPGHPSGFHPVYLQKRRHLRFRTERILHGYGQMEGGGLRGCGLYPRGLMGTMANLREAVRIIQSQGTMPVVLGGDCAVDFPMLQAWKGPASLTSSH